MLSNYSTLLVLKKQDIIFLTKAEKHIAVDSLYFLLPMGGTN